VRTWTERDFLDQTGNKNSGTNRKVGFPGGDRWARKKTEKIPGLHERGQYKELSRVKGYEQEGTRSPVIKALRRIGDFMGGGVRGKILNVRKQSRDPVAQWHWGHQA